MSSGKFYCLFSVFSVIGTCWLLTSSLLPEGWTPCLFHNLTGWPCPACGTTRSLHAFFNGAFDQSVLINPLGLLVGLAGPMILAFTIVDILSGKQRVYKAYLSGEQILKQPPIALTLGLVILANWIWNISKGL